MPVTFTSEQEAFAEAIRDFASRECGTREQRDALTDGGQRAAQRRAVRQDRRPRLARDRGRRGVRRHGRRHGRPLPLPRGDGLRPDPDRRLPGDGDHRRRLRALRHRRAEGRDPRRDRQGQRRGDRDVRARGRLRRRRAALQGGARERRLHDQRPEDLDLRGALRRPHPARLPHRRQRLQARGPDDAEHPQGRRRRRDPRHRDDGRARSSTTSSSTTATSRPRTCSAWRARPGCS